MNGWNLQVLTNYPKTALKLSGKENITIWTIKIWIKIKIKICGYLSKYFFLIESILIPTWLVNCNVI